MGIDLPVIWAVIILFAVMMYVVMDGFDLGIGLLFPFMPRKGDRDVMMNTVAPVWDGNETWLVLGGAGLLAAFPLAYSVILSAFTLPLMFMLLGLIFRGVAFEFRFKADASHLPLWDAAFIGGSFIATFFQGVTLGAFIEGIHVTGRVFTGGALSWVTPFAMFTGVALLAGYALLGCTWLILKTEGRLHDRMRALAQPLTWILLIMLTILTVATPLVRPAIADRWFSLPDLFYFAPVPVLVGVVAWSLLKSVRGDPHAAPFALTLCLVFLGYSGLGISIWPNVIPPDITIWQASSPPPSQGFALVGALSVIPLILGYTAWSYYVFRGKVVEGDGYH